MKIVQMCKRYLKAEVPLFMGFLCSSLILNLLELISPYMAGNFIDGLTKNTRIEFVYRFCFIIVTITLLNVIFGYIVRLIYSKIETKMSYSFNRDMLMHYQKLPLSYLVNKDVAAANKIINMDTYELIRFCIDLFNNMFLKTLTLILLIAFCCYLNLKITIILLSFCVLYIVAYFLLKKRVHHNNFRFKNEQGIFFSRLYEQLENLYFIKAHGIQKQYITRLDDSFQKLYDVSISNQKVNYMFNGLDGFISMGAQIVLYILGGLQIIKGDFTIGQFTIYIAYFNSIYATIKYYFNFAQNYQSVLVSYERMQKLKEEPEEFTGEKIISRIDTIGIHNLTFKFPSSDQILYDDFSYSFEKSKIYGIVGKNGAGKTTFINLLLGLYNDILQSNSIIFNDIDLKELDVVSLRSHCIGISLQHPFLVNDTVKANICFLKSDCDECNINYNTLIERLELGNLLECQVDDPNEKQNNGLSGGEKQKIDIARCLLKNASVIILDEPTASLDMNSTKKVFELMQILKNDKIIIVITHDENMVKQCDEVIHF